MVLWRIMQLGLAHRLSQDLARSNRSRYLCSWRILRKKLEGGRGQDQAQEKSNQKPREKIRVWRFHACSLVAEPSSSKVWVIKLDSGVSTRIIF